MKNFFHHWFQIILDHSLPDPVRNSWNAEWPFATLLFVNEHRSYRWWKIAPRCHAIPDFVQIIRQVFIEHINALFVYSCTSVFGNNFQIAVVSPSVY